MCGSGTTLKAITAEEALERLAKLIGPAFVVSASGMGQTFPTVRTKLANLKEILIDNWDELCRLAHIVHDDAQSEANKIKQALNTIISEGTQHTVASRLAAGVRSPELDLLVETYRKKGKFSA